MIAGSGRRHFSGSSQIYFVIQDDERKHLWLKILLELLTHLIALYLSVAIYIMYIGVIAQYWQAIAICILVKMHQVFYKTLTLSVCYQFAKVHSYDYTVYMPGRLIDVDHC